jgi:peptidoglycan/LPS O-acetylase OafA/YrhL
MGSLRFLLAMSVAYGHLHLGDLFGFPLVPGDTAVQCFFVVSGFYMSLVLNGKYAGAGYWLFVSNRFLRLYPAYAVVFLATVALVPMQIPSIDALGHFYFAISQVTLFAQDAENFLRVQDGTLHFATTVHGTGSNLFDYAPLPQAWTLAVELLFYLLAPFIIRRSRSTLIAVFLASIAVRVILQFSFGLSGDPWSYRFFPSELALFMLGVIAHRFGGKDLIVLSIVVGVILILNRPNGLTRIASVSFLVLVATALPWLFQKTKDWNADRFLGELSYPIYLIHILVGHLIDDRIIALAMVVASAVGLYLLVDKPIDVWRQQRLRQSQAALSEPLGQYRPS